MIVVILIIIAAACNAVMDIVRNKYAWSIFDKYNNIFDSQFWDTRISWRNKYKNGDPSEGSRFFLSTGLLVAFTDGWHLCKSIMIVCLVTAVVLGSMLPQLCIFPNIWMNMLLWIGLLGSAWNLTFSLFYDVILRQ